MPNDYSFFASSALRWRRYIKCLGVFFLLSLLWVFLARLDLLGEEVLSTGYIWLGAVMFLFALPLSVLAPLDELRYHLASSSNETQVLLLTLLAALNLLFLALFFEYLARLKKRIFKRKIKRA